MIVAWLAACGGPSVVDTSASLASLPIGEAACVVCGMMVGEQPSPRGQLVYRDGTHDFVCSIEELRAVAQQPSAKGHPKAIYVETLPHGFDLTSSEVTPLPWVAVADATFVFGAERAGVMGEPVLVFDDPAVASRYSDQLGTQPLPWSSLEQTPFHVVPKP